MLRDLLSRLGLGPRPPAARRGTRPLRSAPPPVAPAPFEPPLVQPAAPAQPAPPVRPQPDAGVTRYGAEGPRAGARVTGVLVGIEGDLKDQICKLGDGRSQLGRAPESQVVLASEWISREHASVEHADGRFHVEPLSPRNPTLLNDKVLEGRTELRDRDVLRLGRSRFRFRAVN